MKKLSRKFLTSLLVLIASLCLFLTACGGKDVAKFTFETFDGPAVESVEVKIGEEYTLPVPERDGYRFEGWYDNSELTGSPMTTVVAEKDMTFYAKWAQSYKITLELGGGTLSASTTILIDEGENVYDAVKDLVPTLADHQFGAWFIGDTELSSGYLMKKEDLVLTARYKVKYTIKAFLQNESGDYVQGEDVIGYEYVTGESFTPPAPAGYSRVEHDGEVASKVLTDNASDNVFTMYFDRTNSTVTLYANYPSGIETDTSYSETIEELYGTEIDIPTNYFRISGYCLAGWSTTQDGPVEYRSSNIAENLYNGTFAADKYTVLGDASLYAVWCKGNTDRFGGLDYIYLLDEESSDIYLQRAGFFFAGRYTKTSQLFTFTVPGAGGQEEVLLQGKLLGDGTYAYYSDSRDGFSYSYYEVGVGLNEKIAIHLDPYNGITYVGENMEESKGTYNFDEEGHLVVEFTSGSMTGTKTLLVGAVNVNGVARPAFQIRNDEEYNWGPVSRGAVYDGGLTYFRDGIYSMTFDGFGRVIFNTGSSESAYYYTHKTVEGVGETISLVNQSGQEEGSIVFVDISGQKCYMFYNEALAGTFPSEDAEEKIVLDGIYSATYIKNGTETKGIYAYSTSAFGRVIDFYPESGAEQCFVLSIKTELGTNDEGKPAMITKYGLREVPATYAEYRYFDESGSVYYAPLIVIDDGEKGTASIYGYIQGFMGILPESYPKLMTGKYTYDEATGKYTLTDLKAEEDANFSTSSVDLTDVTKIVFSVGSVPTQSGYMSVTYWESMTKKDEETKYDKEYTSTLNDGATLTLVNGFAIYTLRETTITGVYTREENGNRVQVMTTDGTLYYFEVDDDESKFTKLNPPLGTAYALYADGTITNTEYLFFDGKGGATLTKITTEEEGEEPKTEETKGTFELLEEATEFQSPIYKFTSDDKKVEFQFLVVATSNYTIFTRYNDKINGQYLSENEEILTLDGYGYWARYIEVDTGATYEGIYTIQEDDVIRLSTDNGYRYFELREGKTFAARGVEYGTYLVMDNQNFLYEVIELDGFGGATVSRIDTESEDGELKELGKGTYTRDENGVVTVSYQADNKTVTRKGALSTYAVSSTQRANIFVIQYEEVATNYVNESDWSILSLNGYGNALRFLSNGGVEIGSYVVVTEHLLYYVNQDGDFACIYEYDAETGTANPVPIDMARSYFTEDLDALLFTQYGFMIMDGQTRYYYNIEDNNHVTLYHQDNENEKANKFGFVEEDFGTFDNTKERDNKTYYLSDGYGITFEREEEGKDLYPVTVGGTTEEPQKYPLEGLTFTPSGSKEFRVAGMVRINQENYNCYVVRQVIDEETGETEMYVTPRNSNLRIYIEVVYKGQQTGNVNANTYKVTAMKNYIQAPSYYYLYNYYMYLAMYGMTIGNSFGVVNVITDFDEDGTAGRQYVTGGFGPYSGMLDSKNEVLTIPEDGADCEMSSRGIITIELKGSDDLTYHMMFSIGQSFYQYFGVYDYTLQALTRVEEFKDVSEGNYTVEVERVVWAESNQYSPGSFWDISITKKDSEEALVHDEAYIVDGAVYYFVRERETEEDGTQGKITKSAVYIVTFESNELAEPEDPNMPSSVVATYKSAKVEEHELSIAYVEGDENGSFVEYYNGTIVFFRNGRSSYVVGKDGTKHENNKYTVTLPNGVQFEITIENDKATITRLEAEAE